MEEMMAIIFFSVFRHFAARPKREAASGKNE
jgi:hypothetical protein